MNRGRIKIVCDLKPTGVIEQDKLIIPKIISSTMSLHSKNVADIKRLMNYYYNQTDIIAKEKTQQPNINNKVAIAYGNMAVTTINGYCFSNSLTFSSRKADNENQMKAFTDSLDDDDYTEKLNKLAFYNGICGLAYKYIVPANKEEQEEGLYYKTYTDIDPEKNYVVYGNSLEDEVICAISFNTRKVYDTNLNVTKSVTVYTVWTKYHQWEFIQGAKGWENQVFDVNGQKYDAYPIVSGEIPLVEYRSLDGTGYFELAIDLINAINVIASSRVDDVQQSVDYIITLRDIDTSGKALEAVKECLKEGILSFKSVPGAIVQPEIDVLDTKLNQQEVQTLQDFLSSKLEEILNIPNRTTKATGGDSGSAVEARSGYRSLENKASLVTASIIKGENKALKVIFAICKNITKCPFSGMKARDVEIKDNRNKYENLTNASNAYSTLRSAGMNDRTALEVTRLVPDAITVSKINEEAKQKETELQLENEITRNTALAKFNQNNEDKSQNSGSDKKKSDDKTEK